MSCKESIITQQQWLKSTCPHVTSPDYNAVRANMAVWATSTSINPKIHLWKEQNQFHQSTECRKLGFSSQGHTTQTDDHHHLVMEGDPSYGAPPMTTGKPSGAGKNSRCNHTAQKTPWSPSPLTFPEHRQGTCSCTLPQWALNPHLLPLVLVYGIITGFGG